MGAYNILATTFNQNREILRWGTSGASKYVYGYIRACAGIGGINETCTAAQPQQFRMRWDAPQRSHSDFECAGMGAFNILATTFNQNREILRSGTSFSSEYFYGVIRAGPVIGGFIETFISAQSLQFRMFMHVSLR